MSPTLSALLTRMTRAMLVCLTLCFAGPLAGQEAASESDDTQPSVNDAFSAPVIVDSETLFVLRGSSALPATERAQAVVERIRQVAESSDAATVSMSVLDTEVGPGIYADGVLVSVVLPGDAELDQLDLEVMVALHRDAIEQAVLDYRAGRTETARVNSALDVLAWTVVFLLFVLLHRYTRRRLPRWLSRIVKRHFVPVEAATQELVKGNAIAAIVQYVLRIAMIFVFFIALYYYLSLVLLAFTETRAVAQLLLTYLTEPILAVGRGFLGFLPNLITLVIICYLTYYVIRGLRVFFEAVEAGTIKLPNFEPYWISPTYQIARGVAIAIAAVFCFPYLPASDSAAFQGLTVLLGVMVSLGSSSVIGNLLSGLFVLYRRSMNIGDRIRVGEHVGDVVAIKLMETHLRSIKNELISIPNSQILNSDVVNYSSHLDGRGLLVHSTVGIGYEEPPEKVEAMLIAAARQTKGLKKSPAPFVLWSALGDFAISYEINAFTTRGASLPQIKSDLHRNIVAIFNRNGVQIMTPSYIADPEVPKIPQEDWNGQLAGDAPD